MISVKIKDQTISVPDKWEEVTVRQYMELVKHCSDLNPVMMLSIFSGIGYETLLNFDCSLFETNILPAMKFVGIDPSFWDGLKVPEYFTVGDRKLTVPMDITKETFGQKVMMHDRIMTAQAGDQTIVDIIPFVLTTYLCPEFYAANYDNKLALKMEPLVMECSIIEAYPTACFFLNRYFRSVKKNLASFN